MTDDKLKIAHLEGQIEAYQAQMQSMAIEFLRSQVGTLIEENRQRQRELVAIQRAFVKFREETSESFKKERAAYVALERRINESEVKQ